MQVPLSIKHGQKLFKGMARVKGKSAHGQKTLKGLISELEPLWNPRVCFRFQNSYSVLPK